MLERDAAEELKNALANARAEATRLCQFVFSNSEGYRALADLYDALARADHLLDSLKAPQPRTLTSQAIRLDSFVALQEADVRNEIESGIALHLDLHASDGVVQADSGQLRTIIKTLVDNARTTLISGGQLTISTAWVDEIPATSAGDPATARRYVRLSISDSRSPARPSDDRMVFVPASGSCQLSVPDEVVCSLVRALGGWTVVESCTSGSRIHVCLPATIGTSRP
jgi:signal transduction histidine kinase